MMSLVKFALFSFAVSCMCAQGASLLTPQSFPKNANDLSFVQDLALDVAGYGPLESEYDASGRCISGCTYPGITIEEELQRDAQNTAMAYNNLPQYGYIFDGRTVRKDTEPAAQLTAPTTSITQMPVASVPSVRTCSPNNPSIPADQKIPIGEPLVGGPRITSPYGARVHPVTGKRQTHWGIDFAAPMGTNVYAPASGTVAAVWTDSTCGNGLRIAHSGGYETVYCHLSQALVKNGDIIQAGCVVAKTGNTGRTTGPHLHYAMKYNGTRMDPTQMVGRN